jgi:hypothetical protein
MPLSLARQHPCQTPGTLADVRLRARSFRRSCEQLRWVRDRFNPAASRAFITPLILCREKSTHYVEEWRPQNLLSWNRVESDTKNPVAIWCKKKFPRAP